MVFGLIELCFLTDIVLNFFMQYRDDEDFKPVRDLKKIALRYLKQFFILDMLATIPFYYLVKESALAADDPMILYDKDMRTKRLVFLFKLLRLPKLQTILDTKNFQDIVKNLFSRRLMSVIKDPSKMKNQNLDNNKIMLQIKIIYTFRVLRLVITILILSYFLGTLWLIFTRETTYMDPD